MKWLLTDEYGLINLDWFSQIAVVNGKLCLTCPDGELHINTPTPERSFNEIMDFLSSDNYYVYRINL